MMTRSVYAFLWTAFLLGCSGSHSGPRLSHQPMQGIPASEHPPDGALVSVNVPASTAAEEAAIRQGLADVSTLDAAGFQARYAVSHVSLGYDPTSAAGLDRVAASSVALSAPELARLATNGFVISEAHRFPSFSYGYVTIYGDHLPLYVSADSILDAVHRSYDNILEQIEAGVLIPELRTLLQNLRSQLAASTAIAAGPRADIDFYLAVASSLLGGASLASPVAGANPADISTFVQRAVSAQGEQTITLFGVDRHVDFSQFLPRGHYADTPELGAYFRAMVWLGRIDFRIIETQPNGTQLFYRRQFEAVLALHALFDADNSARFAAIEQVIQAFVGESDNMQLQDVASLLADLAAPTDATSVDASDARVAQAVLDGGYGAQRIASELMVNGIAGTTLPLNRAFLLFGQRYTVDSNVFSNVVYDRVQHGSVLRMMPSPLDVAFAALGNNQAGALLASEIQKYHYASDLASTRALVDAHPASFWNENFYNLWLSSLRALSPDGSTVDPGAAGLPAITGTEPWGRRMLNAQLSSWAELRRDTILYVKQSYSVDPACEFPDAYVDPYPEFFAALKRFADFGAAQIVPVAARATSTSFQMQLSDYFQQLGTVAQTLYAMASDERTGTPFSADQMAFINQAVTLSPECGGGATGWYPKLVFGNALLFDPTIADVHTEPFNEQGVEVGRVLHVGTGYARLMVVTANTCTGPRAYVGLAGSYFEQITENYDRITDDRWNTQIGSTTPPDVPWMTDLVVR